MLYNQHKAIETLVISVNSQQIYDHSKRAATKDFQLQQEKTTSVCRNTITDCHISLTIITIKMIDETH